MIHPKIEDYLSEFLEEDPRSRYEKLMNPQKKHLFHTEILPDNPVNALTLDARKTFKPSQLNKIIETIGVLGILITTGCFVIVHTGFGGIFFMGAFGWYMKIWHNSPDNRLVLDKKGILYNNTFVFWEDVVSTHIVYSDRRGRDAEDESFLIVEQKNGRIWNFELTKMNFSHPLADHLSKDEKLLGHYIELYKASSKYHR